MDIETFFPIRCSKAITKTMYSLCRISFNPQIDFSYSQTKLEQDDIFQLFAHSSGKLNPNPGTSKHEAIRTR